MAALASRGGGQLWAITSYFNPAGYRRRLLNYHRFREGLEVPLACIEWSRDGHWELGPGNADILVRVSGGDVMWQKERLLNRLLSALPSRCTRVAWLDCDIVFREPGWGRQAASLLDEFPLIQLFRDVHYMPPEWESTGLVPEQATRTRHSLVSGIGPGRTVEECLVHPSPAQRPGTYNNGLAWAARRELVETHGLFDANIIGGGDRALSCAAYGAADHAVHWHHMGAHHEAHYRRWAEAFYQDVRGKVAFLGTEILHLWHGDARHRGLATRHAGLGAFDFDPLSDLALDCNGCWRWNSDKPAMHRFVRDYFASRQEDG